MTPKQLNDEEWKLGLYKGRYTIEDVERDKGKDFYSLYKEFAIGAVPKLKKIPGSKNNKEIIFTSASAEKVYERWIRNASTDLLVHLASVNAPG